MARRERQHRKNKPRKDINPNVKVTKKIKRCFTCDQKLALPGGYSETGLCGPCATGEAETFGETW